MVSRQTGILCDKEFEKNCLDYTALPVGMATVQYSPIANNPFYDGIKAPKNQTMVARPISIDVQAVNRSRLIPGNRFITAQSIMDEVQNDSKTFKPPPVTINEPPSHNEQAASVAEPNVSGLSRGEQILRQEIGKESESADKYLTAFIKLKKDAQILAIKSISQTLKDDNIDVSSYGVNLNNLRQSNQPTRFDQVKRLFEVSLVTGVVIDWNGVFSSSSSSPRAAPVLEREDEESTASSVATTLTYS